MVQKQQQKLKRTQYMAHGDDTLHSNPVWYSKHPMTTRVKDKTKTAFQDCTGGGNLNLGYANSQQLQDERAFRKSMTDPITAGHDSAH